MEYLTILSWLLTTILLALLLIILFKPPWFRKR
jgi:hypothetical protein